MAPDQAITQLQKIVWDDLTVEEAQQEAIVFMNSWDWQEKVVEYTRVVESMTSVLNIASFMWNATMKGLDIKRSKVIGELVES